MAQTQETAAIALAGLDAVIPFQVAPLDVRGRAVQLGPMLDAMLGRHDYPQAVSRLIAEAVTLTVLLGTALKFEGKFILQTQTDGAVPLIVTEFRTPSSVRAYANFDREAVDALVAEGKSDAPSLMGNGILAMTIDQGTYMQRYQGIVQLDGITLEEVARRYFLQSEQIPTEVRLAVGETLTRGEDGKPISGWSAGGVLLQFLPDSEERMRQKDLHGGDGAEDYEFSTDDAWAEALALMGTVEDLELTDRDVEPERLLYRLFHEHGVHAFDANPVFDDCGCSEDNVRGVLSGFTAEQLNESTEEGEITVTCEFCSSTYRFSPSEFTTSQ
ncbi:Hsp33 family molecular chaperone [Pseudahrensia aquimaris]|uniref:Hsp33 family molecular chaperone n=1 Tax=Pseudahrensia aquimaris TaxID=744461 RepID=A0ABW3FEZ3_9HYPH